MSSMFNGADVFNRDLSTWDTSSVTDMSSMFNRAFAFNGDLSTWDTSSVTDMSSMFNHALTFNSDISEWNTSNVKDMNHMFNRATAFNGDISEWDTSNVKDMNHMFNGASSFNSTLSTWDTSSVKDMNRMFNDALAFNGDISEWDTSDVTNMNRMFNGASSFNSTLSTWDVFGVTNMASMFNDATSFRQNLGPWYIVLYNDGTISAQNSFLRNHNPTYRLVDGPGDTNNANFTIANNRILQPVGDLPNDVYSVRIGTTSFAPFGTNNAVSLQVYGDGLPYAPLSQLARQSPQDSANPSLSAAPPGTTPPTGPLRFTVNTDTVPPDLVSVWLDAASSAIHLAFDEPVWVSHAPGFELNATSVNLAGFSGEGTRQISFQVDGAPLGYSTLTQCPTDVSALQSGSNTYSICIIYVGHSISLNMHTGSVRDLSRNENLPYSNLAVDIRDDRMPVPQTARYDASDGVLSLEFDRTVAPANIQSIMLGDSPLRHAELLAVHPTNLLNFVLDPDRRDAVPDTVSVGPGAAISLDGYWSAYSPALRLVPPEAPIRATYYTAVDTLHLETDGRSAQINGSAVTLRNDTARIQLSDIRTVINGDLLFDGNRTLSTGNDTMLLGIPEGSVLLDSRAVPETDDLRVDISDGMGIDTVATFQTGNGTKSALLVGSALVAISGDGVSVFDLDSPGHVSFIPLNRTVLDAIPLPDSRHVAALTGDALLILNVTNPNSPQWTGRLNMSESTYGTITHTVLNGMDYVMVLAQNRATLASVLDPAHPKVVSGAVSAPGTMLHHSASLDLVYTSPGTGSICAFDPTDYEAACNDYRGGVVAMDTVRGAGIPHVISASDAPGISIHNASLSEVSFVETDAIPRDVAGVTIHGTDYILVAADGLHVFDIYGQPVLTVPGGPYVSIHAEETIGSTRAALLDIYGTVSVVDLAGIVAAAGR